MDRPMFYDDDYGCCEDEAPYEEPGTFDGLPDHGDWAIPQENEKEENQ